MEGRCVIWIASRSMTKSQKAKKQPTTARTAPRKKSARRLKDSPQLAVEDHSEQKRGEKQGRNDDHPDLH